MTEIETITIKGIDTKDTARGKVWEIKDGNDRALTTFDGSIAVEAQAILAAGKKALVEVVHKRKEGRNGRFFDNYYIETLIPAPEAEPSGGRGSGEWSQEKEARVSRLSCVKTAAILLASEPNPENRTLNNLFKMADAIMDYAYGILDDVQMNLDKADDDIPF